MEGVSGIKSMRAFPIEHPTQSQSTTDDKQEDLALDFFNDQYVNQIVAIASEQAVQQRD